MPVWMPSRISIRGPAVTAALRSATSARIASAARAARTTSSSLAAG